MQRATNTAVSVNTLNCALELSKNTWLLAIQFPDREQPGIHTIKGGDAAALLAKRITARNRWAKVSGSTPSIVLCYEVGYDVMSASADRQQEVILPRKVHRRHDIGKP